MSTRRRRFGRVRQLPSKRWQARYLGPDGADHAAPMTFATKKDAELWLSRTEIEIIGDRWIDPSAGAISFGDYASTWIRERPNLRPKTVQLYEYSLRRHLRPTFGNVAIREIREPAIRRWRVTLLDSGFSAIAVAKAYRLMKAILNTAVDDRLIQRNPCRIKGAGQETSPERPVLTIAQVFVLADVIDVRYQALVLLAAFGSLRWGELAALSRSDIDLASGTVRVSRQLAPARGGGFVIGPPKSAAGIRTVALPKVIVGRLSEHLDAFVASGGSALVFTSPEGHPLRHEHFRRRIWLPALAATDLGEIHFHDLRHTGNDLAASTGADLRTLMDRMGHSTARAALIYQHRRADRQHQVAEALGKLAEDELRRAQAARDKAERDASGTGRARDPESDGGRPE
jgi:integrase